MIYLGVISSFFLNLIYFLLIKKHKAFSLKSFTFSHLATFKKTAAVFNISTLGLAIVRMIYFLIFIKRLSLEHDYLVIFLIYGALLSMLLTAVIPLTLHERIHEFVGFVMLLFSVLFLIYFHFILPLSIGSFKLLLGKIIVLIMIGGVAILSIKYKKWGIAEAFSTSMIFVWDVYILFCFLI